MTHFAQSVQGVQGSVQGFSRPLHTSQPLCHKAFARLCRVCRGPLVGARVSHAPTRTPMRPHTRGMLSRTYTPLHTLHTLHKVVVVLVSAVQGSKNHPAHPAHPEKTMTTAKIGQRQFAREFPVVPAFFDDLRAAFGAETINAAIRAGMNGQPTFYAEENGRAVGTKSHGEGVTLAETQIGPWRATTQTAGGRK